MTKKLTADGLGLVKNKEVYLGEHKTFEDVNERFSLFLSKRCTMKKGCGHLWGIVRK